MTASPRLSVRELVLLRRHAEDAIHAANRQYAPFVDAVSDPLMMTSLIDMAMDLLRAEAKKAASRIGGD